MARDQNTTSILYEIVFPNTKRYFGISVKSKENRLRRHAAAARHGSRYPVHCALRKYGVKNVNMNLLVVGTFSYVKMLEIAAICRWNTTDRRFGYNVSLGGEGAIGPLIGERVREAFAKPEVQERHRIAMNDPIVKAACLEPLLRPEVVL